MLRRRCLWLVPIMLAPACRPEGAAEQPRDIQVADVGFQTPESVLHDGAADVYLVSNINGSPFAKDDNGFISRISPTGEVLALKWIDGAADGVTLNAPKGMAIKGDTLFVADIDEVRAFHRSTGAPLGSRVVSGATFLNDVAIGPDGTVYLTDSGLAEGFGPSGTDAVYRFDAGRPVAVVRDTSLGRPNGIMADASGLTVVTFGSGEVYTLDPATGRRTQTWPKPPGGSLDGVVRMPDGSLLVSSWETQSVYMVHADGRYLAAVDSVEAPADIGLDAARERVLIPLFMANRVEIRALGAP